MKSDTLVALALGLAALLAGTPVDAQTIPHSSAHPSFNAPQMRRHGSGLHRPNRPTHHHQKGHAGYKPT